jgi:hypothetical protein
MVTRDPKKKAYPHLHCRVVHSIEMLRALLPFPMEGSAREFDINVARM